MAQKARWKTKEIVCVKIIVITCQQSLSASICKNFKFGVGPCLHTEILFMTGRSSKLDICIYVRVFPWKSMEGGDVRTARKHGDARHNPTGGAWTIRHKTLS